MTKENEEGNSILTKVLGGILVPIIGWTIYYEFFANKADPINDGKNKIINEIKKTDAADVFSEAIGVDLKKGVQVKLDADLSRDDCTETDLFSEPLEYLKDIDFENEDGVTILIKFAKITNYPTDSAKYKKFIAEILEKSPNVNKKDRFSVTALIWNTVTGIAADRSQERREKIGSKYRKEDSFEKNMIPFDTHYYLEKKLLENEYINVNLTTNTDLASLLYPWRLKSTKPVIKQPDLIGLTALMCACKLNSIKYVELLLKHGADPSILNKAGKTAFDLTKNETIIQLLNNQR